jgi:hypothetical protein
MVAGARRNVQRRKIDAGLPGGRFIERMGSRGKTLAPECTVESVYFPKYR